MGARSSSQTTSPNDTSNFGVQQSTAPVYSTVQFPGLSNWPLSTTLVLVCHAITDPGCSEWVVEMQMHRKKVSCSLFVLQSGRDGEKQQTLLPPPSPQVLFSIPHCQCF
ncbi:Uncharacterized protein HZ326_0210 [Fusarium oxysporum f. sp. albedinis]|nr:Uncharacterized protein HZ326_0210 [Fusarium oxysporum f. sp. albedinis]